MKDRLGVLACARTVAPMPVVAPCTGTAVPAQCLATGPAALHARRGSKAVGRAGNAAPSSVYSHARVQ